MKRLQDMAKHNICHVEWIVADFEKARAFYTGLFGWEFEAWSENYHVFTADDGFTIALDKSEKANSGNSPRVYVEVESIESILNKTQELGGRIVTQKSEIPNIGWYALILDPEGNTVGLYEALHKENKI